MKCTKKGHCKSKTKAGNCANQLSKCEYKEGNNGKEKACTNNTATHGR
jgi:hypothetical protein